MEFPPAKWLLNMYTASGNFLTFNHDLMLEDINRQGARNAKKELSIVDRDSPYSSAVLGIVVVLPSVALRSREPRVQVDLL
jgi:hypothetical protein